MQVVLSDSFFLSSLRIFFASEQYSNAVYKDFGNVDRLSCEVSEDVFLVVPFCDSWGGGTRGCGRLCNCLVVWQAGEVVGEMFICEF